MNERLMSTAQVAAVLGITRQAVHRLAARGSLPYVRLGLARYFLREKVAEFAASPGYLARTRRRVSLEELERRGQLRLEEGGQDE